MSDIDALLRDLLISNHILAREGVADSLGHVSVRPDRPDRFFLLDGTLRRYEVS